MRVRSCARALVRWYKMNLLRYLGGVLLAAALIRPATSLCSGGYYTDCYNNHPGCNQGYYPTDGYCHWGGASSDPACPSLCGLAWVSRALNAA